MKAISLHQPYASAMGLGLKTIETRSWKPPKRCIGERFVIASTKIKPREDRYGQHTVKRWPANEFHPLGVEGQRVLLDSPRSDEHTFVSALPLGRIVASGVLTAAVPTDCINVNNAFFNRARPEAEHRAWWPDPHDDRVHVHADEIPWGDFSPGRWAWLFSDLARVEDRCPWCDPRFTDLAGQVCGAGVAVVPGHTVGSGWDWVPCPVCDGAGSCPPIPVKGKQRVYEVTLEDMLAGLGRAA